MTKFFLILTWPMTILLAVGYNQTHVFITNTEISSVNLSDYGLQIAEAMDSVTSDSYLVSKVSGLSDRESSSSWALHSTSTGGRRSILSRPWESWRTATAWASGRGPGWWGWPARGCRACRGCTPAASRGVRWMLSVIITLLPRTPQSRQCWATTTQWQERLFQECSQQRSLKRHQECFGWSHLYSKRFKILWNLRGSNQV